MRAEPLPEREAKHLSGFEEFRVDLADRREGVEVQREADAERHQQHLGQFADTEPQDEQRDQAEVRQRPEHLHRRVDGRLEPPRQTDRGAQRDAEEPAEQQTLERPGRPTPAVRRPVDRSRISSSPASTISDGAGSTSCGMSTDRAAQLPQQPAARSARPTGSAPTCAAVDHPARRGDGPRREATCGDGHDATTVAQAGRRRTGFDSGDGKSPAGYRSPGRAVGQLGCQPKRVLPVDQGRRHGPAVDGRPQGAQLQLRGLLQDAACCAPGRGTAAP